MMEWSRLDTEGNAPPARGGCSVTALTPPPTTVPTVFLFGGADRNGECYDDLHRLFLSEGGKWTWEKVEAAGDRPSCRFAHSACALGHSLVLFGGQYEDIMRDLYILDSVELKWTRIPTTDAFPPPRNSHTATAIGRKMFVFGGANQEGLLNDLHVFDLDDSNWTKPACTGNTPLPREMHGAAAIGNQLVIYGGRSQKNGQVNFHGELTILNTDTMDWTSPILSKYPRCAHTMNALPSKNQLLIFGGNNDAHVFNDVVAFDLGSKEFSHPEVTGNHPEERFAHGSTNMADGRVLVAAGVNVGMDLASVYILKTN